MDQPEHDAPTGAAGTEPDEWEELADELSGNDRPGHRSLWIAIAGLVVIVGVALVLWQPWSPRDSGGGRATKNSSSPASESPADPLAGPGGPLGLMADPWPAEALTALKTEQGVTTLSRILLTADQIQATGADATGAWQDFVYVEDSALPLGDPLIPPRQEDEFSLADVDANAIGKAATSTVAGAKSGIDVTQVIVERDALADGAPIVIEVYWKAGDDLQVSRFDATGTPLG
ncbi:hypothetical protein GCM10010401_13290 [Rarobacter faecitabidus]|uniref:Uncharacterized protein n=1 Tax=Rarobacter faecitabidus TaxID=13243 RepID=A0A542ZE62_RARFA|nr:hypothetical protein [Rarobacter faecitabidus]TQL58623.1 hypothetical protein FB461_2041 [Rarobacter faecitabidus]